MCTPTGNNPQEYNDGKKNLPVGYFIPEGFYNCPVGGLPSGKFQATRSGLHFPVDKNPQ